jgi:predicted regulator of Ras-like GTPase activity (Roadblock/LC7/MglB family)
MALQGSLQDMSVADLIQHNCQEGRTARIDLRLGTEGPTAVMFLDQGQIVHAESQGEKGEEVVYQVLAWGDGTFSVEPGQTTPERTIQRSYAGLLLEGIRRIDEAAVKAEEPQAAGSPPTGDAGRGSGKEEGKMSERLQRLRAIEGVTGVVIAARDGVVLEHALDGDPDKEGAVAVFVGYAAAQVGESLALGNFEWGTVAIGKGTMLVVERPDFYVGLLLEEKASPALVASKLEGLLRA